MPDIGHLTFEGSPETLDGLVVAGRAGARHAFLESVLFHERFRAFSRVLATSVAVVHSVHRAVGVSAYGHFKGFLDDILPLMPLDRPADQSSRRHVDDAAGIELPALAFQLGDIRTPKMVGNGDTELIFDQILFDILLFRGFGRLWATFSAAFGRQSVLFQDSRDLVFADGDPASRQLLFDADPAIVPVVLIETVNDGFFKFNFVTFFCLGNTVIRAS